MRSCLPQENTCFEVIENYVKASVQLAQFVHQILSPAAIRVKVDVSQVGKTDET
jgi:hypothetical protein